MIGFRLAIGTLATLVAVGPARGQSGATRPIPETRAAGAVVRTGGAGQLPVAGSRVVLHRVGRATQGPIDTVITDERGRFAFRFPADTTASFLLSSNYAGIEYFSQPLATNPARPDTGIQILVYDTTSTGPVRTLSRTVVIGAPDAIGARTVIDWLVLENPSGRTRVGRDTTEPTWGGALPIGARNPVVGDARLSQVSPDAVLFRNDSVLVLAPLSPGQKEVLLQYEIPQGANRFDLAVGATDSADAFVEESSARLRSGGWVVRDSQLFEGRPFRRIVRTSADAPRLTIDFHRTGTRSGTLPAMVGLTALALAVATVGLMRRSGRALPAPSTVALADRIAGLDVALERGDGDPGERARREQERAALLDQLRAALARRGPES